jgi:GTP-binding protein
LAIADLLDSAAVAYQIVLTKADKLDPAETAQTVAAISSGISKRPAAHPYVHVTSAASGAGVAELRADIARLAGR